MGMRGKSLARRSRRAVWSAGMLAALFVAASFAAPFLLVSGAPGADLLQLAFTPLCHQLVERSLPVGPGHQAVCARCCGLYLGGVTGLMLGALLGLSRSHRPRPIWLALLAIPTMIDLLLPWVGLVSLSNLPRLLIALPFGTIAGMFLAVGIVDLLAPQTRVTAQRIPVN